MAELTEKHLELPRSLAKRYYSRVVPYLFDEIVSEGYVALLHAAKNHQPREGSTLESYLHTCVRLRQKGVYLFWLGKSKCNPTHAWNRLVQFSDDSEYRVAEPLQEELSEESRLRLIAIHEEIDALPERDRKILLAYYVENKGKQALSRELNIPKGTVLYRLRVTEKKLKSAMSLRGLV